MPTYPRSPSICVQYGFFFGPISKERIHVFFLHATHTPARTLVMSRTRIPANGSVGKSAAAVARPLQSGWWKPLSRIRGLRYLARPIIDVLEIAIMHQKSDVEVE